MVNFPTGVSLVCLVYAWPCAYLIAKHGGRYRLVLVLLTAAPFLTGILLRVTAMQQIPAGSLIAPPVRRSRQRRRCTDINEAAHHTRFER